MAIESKVPSSEFPKLLPRPDIREASIAIRVAGFFALSVGGTGARCAKLERSQISHDLSGVCSRKSNGKAVLKYRLLKVKRKWSMAVCRYYATTNTLPPLSLGQVEVEIGLPNASTYSIKNWLAPKKTANSTNCPRRKCYPEWSWLFQRSDMR